MLQHTGFKPDVVLLDIGMPHMSGYEVAQSLRETGAEQPAVLVAITGLGTGCGPRAGDGGRLPLPFRKAHW